MGTEPTPKTLVHICSRAEWEAAQEAGEYRAASLAEVGFIHLSGTHQAHLPADRLFRGRDDLVLLWLDPERLGSPVKWEPGVPGDPESMLFPHLYGPLPLRAVVEATPFRPGPEGTFAPLVES
ncbi:DUF952 domain-containing protein [Nocardia huaxiensis]|uniref:DUF952 domain-containing protein n=1 Tax=Nocardia huaxiensis TaxID=2755382 RepID=A0A7D6V930_9NOCA|nr:DUF952 domain-containing protein [Nocardia huaxiensis]QLY29393.1 DUF952 domain-containing protein [Nocardia huaxiensis]